MSVKSITNNIGPISGQPWPKFQKSIVLDRQEWDWLRKLCVEDNLPARLDSPEARASLLNKLEAPGKTT